MPIHNFDVHFGVDMTGREQKMHFRTLENLYRKHLGEDGEACDGNGIGRALERTVGFRRLLSTGAKIHSLFFSESDHSLFIHAGKRLYRLTMLGLAGLAENEEEEDRRRTSYTPAASLYLSGIATGDADPYIYDFLPERPIAAAAVGRELYFADGVRLYRYDNEKFTVVASLGTCKIGNMTVTSVSEPYAPLRMLDGTVYEQRNLLTDRYRQRHTFRESDELCDGNAPLVFVRLGLDDHGVETCRADSCVLGNYGSTLVIPSSTIVDGVKCAVTEIAQTLLSGETRYDTLVLPYTVTSLPEEGLLNCPSIRTVRIPRGVNEIEMRFFNGCASSLRLEYEGTEAEWGRVQVHTEGYTGTYTLAFGYSENLLPYGIRLAEDSSSVGMCYLDGAPALNKESDDFHFFARRNGSEESSPYSHIYILARTEKSLYGRTFSVNAYALPFCYVSEEGRHALATTEGALRKDGVLSGDPNVSDYTIPEGRSLVCGCRLLTAYDRRLFFSGLPTIPDVIFYSHEDADGNPDPTYVGTLNYMTDGDRMPITGMYSAGGELCVTHASRTRGKLQTHTYALPDTADALFVRLYPVRAVYSTACVRAATVYEGRLHMLTDDGIFVYTRSSSDGYLNARSVAGRIAPVIASLSARRESTPFFAALGRRLALFDGTDLYLGDSALAPSGGSSYEYEWYPQRMVGSYSGDSKMFISCTELPDSLLGAFFVDENNKVTDLSCEKESKVYKESEVEKRVAKTLEDGRFYDHTVYCAKKSGALVDLLGYRTGGTLHAPSAAALFGDLLVFGTEEGALLAYNTDTDYERAGRPYYLSDGHRTAAFLRTFDETDGRPTAHKRTKPGSSYVFLRPMTDSAPHLTLRADGRAREQMLPSAPFAFDRLDFSNLSFMHGDTARLPIPEPYDYLEKSYTLDSEMPFAFLGISYSYTLKD